MNDLVFAIQVVLERYLAPILLLLRRWFAGYPYRRIPLTQGRFARVDPEDYAGLARHKWCVARQGNSVYAVRCEGNRQLRMHRVIMNVPPHLAVNRIDRDGLNNTKRNLRLYARSRKAHNQRPQTGRSSHVEKQEPPLGVPVRGPPSQGEIRPAGPECEAPTTYCPTQKTIERVSAGSESRPPSILPSDHVSVQGS